MDRMNESSRPAHGGAFTTLGSVIGRRWPVVLLAVLLTGGLWLALEMKRSERFESTARVLIQSQDLGSSLADVPSLSAGGDPSRAFATEKEIADLPEIRQNAEAAIAAVHGTDPTAEQTLSSAVNTDGSSDVLLIRVVAATAPYAEALATALGTEYVRYREDLQTSEYRKARDEILAQARELAREGGTDGAAYQDLISRAQQLSTVIIVGSGRARVIAPGDAATQIAPRPTRAAGMGIGFGLLVGIALALLLERLDGRVRSREEMEQILGVPAVGWLPDPKKVTKRSALVCLTEPDGPESEAFRLLRTNLVYSLGARGERSFLVTSPSQGDGKSFTVSNLAVTAAAGGRRVAVLDLDLRRPTLHRYFGMDRTPGVTDVVAGLATLDEVRRAVDLPLTGLDGGGSLSIVTAGGAVPSPGEYLLSERLRDLIRAAQQEADLLIIDAPPALAVSDAVALGAHVASCLIVVRADAADRAQLRQVQGALAQGGPKPLGIALTASWGRRGKPYGYYESTGDAAQRTNSQLARG